jgi:hypothetical protein
MDSQRTEKVDPEAKGARWTWGYMGVEGFFFQCELLTIFIARQMAGTD